MQHITTPVRVHEWQQALSHHPDQRFVNYIINGLNDDFRIGYNWDKAGRRQCGRNMANSDSQAIVSEYLESELLANRVVKLIGGSSDDGHSLQSIRCHT